MQAPLVAPGSTYLDTSWSTLKSFGQYIGRRGRIWRVREVVWIATKDFVDMEKTELKACTLVELLSMKTQLKKADVDKALRAMAAVVKQELKGNKKVVLPGVCMLATETTPAMKVGKRMVRKTIVKAFPATALTKNI